MIPHIFVKTYNFNFGDSLCHTKVIFHRTLER